MLVSKQKCIKAADAGTVQSYPIKALSLGWMKSPLSEHMLWNDPQVKSFRCSAEKTAEASKAVIASRDWFSSFFFALRWRERIGRQADARFILLLSSLFFKLNNIVY